MNQRHQLLIQQLNPNPLTHDFVMNLTGEIFYGKITHLDHDFETDSWDCLTILGDIPKQQEQYTFIRSLQVTVPEGSIAFRISDDWITSPLIKLNWQYCALKFATEIEATVYLKNN